jgi:hypothetical protein
VLVSFATTDNLLLPDYPKLPTRKLQITHEEEMIENRLLNLHRATIPRVESNSAVFESSAFENSKRWMS